MTERELESKHIAELHSLAADAGVEGYRKLRREDLIERLAGTESRTGSDDSDATGEGSDGDGSRSRPRRSRSGRESRRGGRSKGKASVRKDSGKPADEDAKSADQEESLTGYFLPDPRGGGLIRLEGKDAELSAAQVKRCELRAGDLVEGVVKAGKKGRANVVRVESVNGAEPVTGRSPAFDELTPVTPTRRLQLEIASDDVLTRSADLLAPLAYGQRVLIKAESRSGRTSLLRGISRSIVASPAKVSLSVLLIDEKPEDATGWRDEVGADGEVHAATADMHTKDQLELAELALSRAKRQAEAGADVVLVIDSLTRLAIAADDPAIVKRFFGAGRDLAESGAGSLTVIATVLTDVEEGSAVLRAVETTESTSLELSSNLAAEGVVPALVAIRPSVAGEELIREKDELSAARRLRAELRLMPAEQAAQALSERIGRHATNADLLAEQK